MVLIDSDLVDVGAREWLELAKSHLKSSPASHCGPALQLVSRLSPPHSLYPRLRGQGQPVIYDIGSRGMNWFH